jgi:hypothetical protein
VVLVLDVLVANVEQILAAIAPRQRLVADAEVRVLRRLVHVLVLPARWKRWIQPCHKEEACGEDGAQGHTNAGFGGGTHEASQLRNTPATKMDPTPVIFFHSSTSSAQRAAARVKPKRML